MIETIATNVVRCDVCHKLLEEGDDYKHMFRKDICVLCMESILEKLESERILTLEQFDEAVDVVRYKF